MVRFLILATTLLIAVILVPAKDITKEQKKDIAKLEGVVAKAGQFFLAKKYKECGKEIEKATELLETLAGSGDEEVIKLINKNYNRVKKAGDMLTIKNIEVPILKSLEDMKSQSEPQETKDAETTDDSDKGDSDSGDADAESDSNQISFTSKIVPILSQNCGSCHIRQAKGKFSAASFESLLSSKDIVNPGKPDESDLIFLVEEGEMPPKRSLKKEDIQLLREWVAQGAKFDGKNKKDKIGQTGGRPSRPGRGIRR